MYKRKSRNTIKADPYCHLAISILDQAFKDIKKLYGGKCKKRDRLNGIMAEQWIMEMNGTFNMVADAAKMDPIDLYRLCLERIEDIKDGVE